MKSVSSCTLTAVGPDDGRNRGEMRIHPRWLHRQCAERLSEQYPYSHTRFPATPMAARTSRQDIDFIRTTPKQSRSEATVEAIFAASARILQRNGVAAFNTNAVAALAGVSVGTLHQYFANKDAILIAMARRELGEALAGVVSGLRSKRGAPDVEPARAAGRRGHSNSRRRLRRMNGEWTGAPGTMRPSSPHSAMRLNGITARSPMCVSTARKSATIPFNRASTSAGSE